MSPGLKILIVFTICVAVVLVVLYIFGKKTEKKQAEQEKKMAATAQQITLLVIDKRKMKIKDAGFPAFVLENTPKYLRHTKFNVVKAKVGPRIMTLMCDPKVYDQIPLKTEVKATVSGIYITKVKGVRTPLEPPKKKKGLFGRKK